MNALTIAFLLCQALGVLLLIAICRAASRPCLCPRCRLQVEKCSDEAFEPQITFTPFPAAAERNQPPIWNEAGDNLDNAVGSRRVTERRGEI